MGMDDSRYLRALPVEGQMKTEFAGRFPASIHNQSACVHHRDVFGFHFIVLDAARADGDQTFRALENAQVAPGPGGEPRRDQLFSEADDFFSFFPQ